MFSKIKSWSLKKKIIVGAIAFVVICAIVGMSSDDDGNAKKETAKVPRVGKIFDKASDFTYRLNSAKTGVVIDGLKKENEFYENTYTVVVPAEIEDFPVVEIHCIKSSPYNTLKNLVAVELPPSVTLIGASAFSYCPNLRTVVLPNVIEIENSAFSECKSLQSITLPATKKIGGRAFEECTSLALAFLPVATEIGRGTFQNCSARSKR